MSPAHTSNGPALGSPTTLLFADLDDTCFQTERKCALGTALYPAAWDRSGEAISFQTPAQSTLLTLLTAGARMIPVTGRNRDAVDRTVYRDAPFAITSFGAVIHTPDGPDAEWEALQRLAQPSEECLLGLGRIVEHHVAASAGVLRCSLVRDAGRIRYLSVKASAVGTTDPLTMLVNRLKDRAELDESWRLYRTDRSLAIAPPQIEKAAAVEHFLRTVTPSPSCTIGIGDGPADAGFLALCDFAITPRGSTLFRHLVALTP